MHTRTSLLPLHLLIIAILLPKMFPDKIIPSFDSSLLRGNVLVGEMNANSKEWDAPQEASNGHCQLSRSWGIAHHHRFIPLLAHSYICRNWEAQKRGRGRGANLIPTTRKTWIAKLQMHYEWVKSTGNFIEHERCNIWSDSWASIHIKQEKRFEFDILPLKNRSSRRGRQYNPRYSVAQRGWKGMTVEELDALGSFIERVRCNVWSNWKRNDFTRRESFLRNYRPVKIENWVFAACVQPTESVPLCLDPRIQAETELSLIHIWRCRRRG